MRVGVINDWDSKWFAEKDYAALLVEDAKIRQFLKKNLFVAGISKIGIKRVGTRIKIAIYTAKPGMVIGRGGTGIEDIKKALATVTDKEVDIDILEIKSKDMSAILVGEDIASQLERRIGFRRAVKQAVGRTMRMGAKGIKVTVSGRLGGAEIARSESYREGSIPLQTLRANIDYAVATAHTTYGAIGIKVWIYKGELAPGQTVDENENIRTSKDRGNRHENGNRRGGRRGDRRERRPRNEERTERSDS
jgi:ribosomal protein S3